MQLTFSCPSCGKDYEVPWSMAGRRARCKGCWGDFVVPAPYEPKPPGSSEAIPVVPAPPEPPRAGPAPRPARLAAAVPPPEPPAPRRAEAPSTGRSTPPRPPLEPAPSTGGAGRPPWLIPTVAGGGVVAILAVNVGLFFAFAFAGRGQGGGDRDEVADAAGLGPLVAAPVVAASEEDEAPGKTPSAPIRPAVADESPPDGPMNTADIVARYEPSVALIKGKKGSGTGFIARPGIVATNAHVIGGERVKDLEVRFPSAEESKRGPYNARLLYQDKARDLALLGVAADLPPVRVAEGYKFRKGEDVTVIGNPGVGGQMILENAISRGIVSSMTRINEHSFLQLGISINPGNSGGPVFDPKGRVIGVVTLKTTRQEGLAFAIPAEDLHSALGVAETMAGNEPADGTAGANASPGGAAPALAYAFKPGQTYAYSVELAIDAGATKVVLSGGSVYRVKAVDAEGITLGHKGWLAATKRGQDGRTLPGGGPGQANEVELKIDDKGNVVRASGASPLPLLGDFAMLLIEPLPDDPAASWDDSRTIALREVEQAPGAVGNGPRLGRPGLDNLPKGPRARPGLRARPGSRLGVRPQPIPPPQPQVKVTLHEASEETRYTLGAVEGDRAPIRKLYELATKEMVGREPRLRMVGEGTLTFDVKAGIPLALSYKMDVVEVAGNVTTRVPVTVSCKLLEGKDRDKGPRPPAPDPSAMNKLGNAEATRLVADRAGDDQVARDAEDALQAIAARQ